jgi:hypothetical protein
MVPFLSKRQCTVALTVALLILLMGLLSSPNPALAQSAVALDTTSGPLGTEVTATGSGWIPKVIAISANSTWRADAIFQVTEPGRLRVIEALHMPNTKLPVGERVTALFTVKNVGGSALHLEKLTAAGRHGSDWKGERADFPHVLNITLQTIEEYSYQQSRSFEMAGAYFAEPVVKINGQWGGI